MRRMKAHAKLWSAGLYQQCWWYSAVTTLEEFDEMKQDSGAHSAKSMDTVNCMYAMFFALYFAEIDNYHTISV